MRHTLSRTRSVMQWGEPRKVLCTVIVGGGTDADVRTRVCASKQPRPYLGRAVQAPNAVESLRSMAWIGSNGTDCVTHGRRTTAPVPSTAMSATCEP